MSSKKKGKEQAKKENPKRAEAPLRTDYSSQFKKDWERIRKAGRQNLRRAKDGMMLLIGDDAPLPAEYFDHELSGEWANHREFHAGGDLLVIYLRRSDAVIFERIGTHAELFE